MFNRISLQWLVGVASLILLMILWITGKYSNPIETQIALTTEAMQSLKIQNITNVERKAIRKEMKDYEYPNGKYGISARNISDLVIEENGRPFRNLILTTWRSGSTFFSDAINAHPATFFHHEPLIDFDYVRIRGPPLAAEALERVRALFNCEYQDLDKYIDYLEAHSWPLPFNRRLWRQCEIHKDLCYEREFHSAMCKLFPIQLMKLVRLDLGVAQELLEDKKLAVRIVLLVRDPRGTLQSRKHRTWCLPYRDCSDPSLLCADLASDYKLAVKLLKKYPTTFKVVRYEDLAVKPYELVKEVCEFYGLDYHEDIKSFLDTHTKYNSGGVSSTFRDSKSTPFHWRTDFKFEEVEEIQQSCTIAMKLWGYLPAINATHQREFDPVDNSWEIA